MIEPPSTTARYTARSGLSLIMSCIEVPRVPIMAPVAARATDQAYAEFAAQDAKK